MAQFSPLKINCAFLCGVRCHCMLSPAGPGSWLILSTTFRATVHAFFSIFSSSRFLMLPSERAAISSYASPSIASWHVHCMAPPSTSVSPIHAFDLSASFWPLSSLLCEFYSHDQNWRFYPSWHLCISLLHSNTCCIVLYCIVNCWKLILMYLLKQTIFWYLIGLTGIKSGRFQRFTKQFESLLTEVNLPTKHRWVYSISKTDREKFLNEGVLSWSTLLL